MPQNLRKYPCQPPLNKLLAQRKWSRYLVSRPNRKSIASLYFAPKQQSLHQQLVNTQAKELASLNTTQRIVKYHYFIHCPSKTAAAVRRNSIMKARATVNAANANAARMAP